MTDLNILGFRFPGAGQLLARGRTSRDDHRFEPAPALAGAPDRRGMLIGEVKEGKAELNRAARNPRVLEAGVRVLTLREQTRVPEDSSFTRLAHGK